MNKDKLIKKQFAEGLKLLLEDFGFSLEPIPTKVPEQRTIDTAQIAGRYCEHAGLAEMSLPDIKVYIDSLEKEVRDLEKNSIILTEEIRKFLQYRAHDAHTQVLYDSHGNLNADRIKVISQGLSVKKRVLALAKSILADKSKELFIKEFRNANPRGESIFNTYINEHNELVIFIDPVEDVENDAESNVAVGDKLAFELESIGTTGLEKRKAK